MMAGGPLIVLGTSALVCVAGCNQLFGLDPAAQRATDAVADDDGDVPDALDGLPIDARAIDSSVCANPLGTPDEDSDGRRDLCDNCPHVYQAGTQEDADGDGVGDLCDPRPGMPDRLIAFHNFEGIPANYVPLPGGSPGPWTIGGGRLNLLDGAAATHYLARFDVDLRTVAIATQVTITEVPSLEVAPYSHGVGAWVNVDPANNRTFPDGIVYELVDSVPLAGQPRKFTHLVDTTPATNVGENSLDDVDMWVVDRVYQLVLTCDGVSGTCRATASYNNNVEAAVMLDPLNMRDGAVGLRVFGCSATFDYVAIYGPG